MPYANRLSAMLKRNTGDTCIQYHGRALSYIVADGIRALWPACKHTLHGSRTIAIITAIDIYEEVKHTIRSRPATTRPLNRSNMIHLACLSSGSKLNVSPEKMKHGCRKKISQSTCIEHLAITSTHTCWAVFPLCTQLLGVYSVYFQNLIKMKQQPMKSRELARPYLIVSLYSWRGRSKRFNGSVGYNAQFQKVINPAIIYSPGYKIIWPLLSMVAKHKLPAVWLWGILLKLHLSTSLEW